MHNENISGLAYEIQALNYTINSCVYHDRDYKIQLWTPVAQCLGHLSHPPSVGRQTSISFGAE